MRALLLILILSLPLPLKAEELPPPDNAPDSGAVDPHPVISAKSDWPKDFVIGIFGLFAAAAIVGTLVRRKNPD